jgi:dimethylaniline monooxygenase (N-oxide forming)
VAPFPTHIDEQGVVHFPDNGSEEYRRIKDQTIKPDVIVFATGYLQSFPFLESPRNAGRKPYPRADEADVREIWRRDDPTVGFIGFVRPGFGAIPPLSELQVMLWIMNLLGKVTKPLVEDDQWHYRLIAPPDARVSYGVEHDSYAFQLAADMDAVAGITDVFRLGWQRGTGPFWRLPWIWAASTNFTVKFRLVGPWAWEGATGVMTDDLWEVISRRHGLFGESQCGLMLRKMMMLTRNRQLHAVHHAGASAGTGAPGRVPVRADCQLPRRVRADAARQTCEQAKDDD